MHENLDFFFVFERLHMSGLDMRFELAFCFDEALHEADEGIGYVDLNFFDDTFVLAAFVCAFGRPLVLLLFDFVKNSLAPSERVEVYKFEFAKVCFGVCVIALQLHSLVEVLNVCFVAKQRLKVVQKK